MRRALPSLRRVATPILSGVSARFRSGEVGVVMGPSGSGKSTFLRLCAGRGVQGARGRWEPGGEVRVGGVRVGRATRGVCAFVEQGASVSRGSVDAC